MGDMEPGMAHGWADGLAEFGRQCANVVWRKPCKPLQGTIQYQVLFDYRNSGRASFSVRIRPYYGIFPGINEPSLFLFYYATSILAEMFLFRAICTLMQIPAAIRLLSGKSFVLGGACTVCIVLTNCTLQPKQLKSMELSRFLRVSKIDATCSARNSSAHEQVST